MKVDVLPVTGSLGQWARGRGAVTCQPVVIDVLRATSTIVTALAAGARAVVPRRTPEEVTAEAARRAAEDPAPLRAGERGGLRISGFDLGNSPREFTAAAVRGRTICFTTTNGTRALDEASALGPVACASMLNRAAVARWLWEGGRDVVILCAGTEDAFSSDDLGAAGAVIEALRGFDAGLDVDDQGLVAEAWYQSSGGDAPALLARSRHGRHLREIGFGEDLAACGAVDALGVVPVYRDGLIRL